MTNDERQSLIAALGQTISDEIERAMAQHAAQYAAQLAKLEAKLELQELTVREYRWCGVWAEKSSYRKGNSVTHQGSTWFCNIDTQTQPGKDFEAWTLIAKGARA